ncbi:MAG: hypothetical protein ACRBB3_04995 [Alphaproteobacteria bacterium]
MADKNFGFSLNNSSINISQAYRNVVPQFLKDFWNADDKPEDEFPESLSLKIADKEDTPQIEAFFQSRRKKQADPGNFVKPRPEDPVKDLSSNGHIALIEDHNEEITAVCFAFKHKVDDMPGHELQQSHAEIGTVLSCAKGLGLTAVAISALTLALKEKEGEDYPIIAKVSKENKAANGLFGKSLGWEVTEQTDEIKALFKSSAGNTMRPEKPTTPAEDKEIAESRNWYVFGEAAEDQARELLHTIQKDKCIHTKSRKEVPFEFDAEDFNISLKNEEQIPEEEWIDNTDVVIENTGTREPKRPLDIPPEDHILSEHGDQEVASVDSHTEISAVESIIDRNLGPLDAILDSEIAINQDDYDDTDLDMDVDEQDAEHREATLLREEEEIFRRLNVDSLDM